MKSAINITLYISFLLHIIWKFNSQRKSAIDITCISFFCC